MLNNNRLSDWGLNITAVSFIVICLSDSAMLITGTTPEDITLSSLACRFIDKSKTASAEELLQVRITLR